MMSLRQSCQSSLSCLLYYYSNQTTLCCCLISISLVFFLLFSTLPPNHRCDLYIDKLSRDNTIKTRQARVTGVSSWSDVGTSWLSSLIFQDEFELYNSSVFVSLGTPTFKWSICSPFSSLQCLPTSGPPKVNLHCSNTRIDYLSFGRNFFHSSIICVLYRIDISSFLVRSYSMHSIGEQRMV
jgi:hypothetical protein